MDTSFVFPCLVIGIALIALTGFHVTLGRWIGQLRGNRQPIRGEVSTPNAKGSRSFAYWAMFVIIAIFVIGIVVLVMAFIFGAVLYSQLPSAD